VETKWIRLKRTQTRSWNNGRLVKAKKSEKEVLNSKPSTASSDEEKLAAGITTIGLQAKRLSGAQRKKARKRKKDGGGNLDGRKTKKEHSRTISLKGCGASGANADGP
jgi:hypothetical protein